ncbi:urease accessory protein UreF [Neiella marina]|uniref:Urease accessory protein UreF n=1 Tax=Neiella holothuriorum TaxID=2870530 RepID=A0ABS7EJG5_9GAMM|nr:urease accessory UreF family protein [Neiella holothuriorum]MBW8192497.1 urease accessory protein UreF [Neiella holothuriorum]
MKHQQLLSLLHLSSPSLPIGAFAYSQGLETAVDLDWVTDEKSLLAWLEPQLRFSLSQLEVPLLSRCYSAWQQQDYAAINHWQAVLLANRDSAELLKEELQLGSTLHRLLSSLDCNLPSQAKGLGYLPMFAYALAHYDIELESGLCSWLWSWLENQITVACKTIPLGQTPAQQTLLALMPAIETSVQHGLAVTDEQIGMTLPNLAMVSAWHETQYSRLFRS